MVIFPQRSPCFVGAGKGTELAHYNALGCRFQRQRHDNPLHVFPLFDDQLWGEFTDWTEDILWRVLTGMLEAV